MKPAPRSEDRDRKGGAFVRSPWAYEHGRAAAESQLTQVNRHDKAKSKKTTDSLERLSVERIKYNKYKSLPSFDELDADIEREIARLDAMTPAEHEAELRREIEALGLNYEQVCQRSHERLVEFMARELDRRIPRTPRPH